jgi:hypothetical protein
LHTFRHDRYPEGMTKYLFRPSLLIALSAAVVVGAVYVVFQSRPTQTRPTPLPVGDNDREIVWLYTATNAPSWERFVAAVRRTAERLQVDHPGLEADLSLAFPEHTTAVPQVILTLPEGPRFLFRWYKLTSGWKTHDWIEALLNRRSPPLAIIGGSSSDAARDLAGDLQEISRNYPETDRPLLLLTTATADRVAPVLDDQPDSARPNAAAGEETDATGSVPLMSLYPGRTFRFCFTNTQMATAVSQLIWTQDDLRPDRDPVYMAQWNDDSYSRDLIDGFWGALRMVVAQSSANEWMWLSGTPVNGQWPPLLIGGIFPTDRLLVNPFVEETASRFRLSIPPTPQVIDSSVGSFAVPNRYEAKVAQDLLDQLQNAQSPPKRPLLIVTGQTQPSRRFLRALIRAMPDLANRLVVATGDAIAFNTVYRDRQVAWNIQDLPFPLVFFCHHNPVDRDAGFRPVGAGARVSGENGDASGTASTGTEDVLLYADIIESVLQAAVPPGGQPCASAGELRERLAGIRLQDDRLGPGPEGVPLFGPDGQRQSGTGEHVVCVRPVLNDFRDRLLPLATIEVWAWRRREWTRAERGQHWHLCGEPLLVSYSGFAIPRGGTHDD